MKTIFKVLCAIIGFLLPVLGILFIIYFWNFDQKLMGGVYQVVNKVFDRKPADIQF